MDVNLDIWTDDQAVLHSRAALVGHRQLTQEAEQSFEAIKLQITGLDAIAGVGPIKSAKHPSFNEGYIHGEWTFAGHTDSAQKWHTDDAAVRLEFDCRASFLDPFGCRLAFSPVVVIELAQPISFDECLRRWVDPLRRLISVATGRPEDITFLSLGATTTGTEELPTWAHWLQVYGLGLTQEPFTSQMAAVRSRNPSFTTYGDQISLLDLVSSWWNMSNEGHPLLETFANFTVIPEEHPRSRYLLLIQALEGLHGYENAARHTEENERHEERRRELLSDPRITYLSTDRRKFLKKNLGRRPLRNLDTHLGDLIGSLPTDVTSELEQTTLVKDTNESSAVAALRVIRNNLAHGTKGYDANDLRVVVKILDRVTRAHLLRVLGCSETVQQRTLDPRRR